MSSRYFWIVRASALDIPFPLRLTSPFRAPSAVRWYWSEPFSPNLLGFESDCMMITASLISTLLSQLASPARPAAPALNAKAEAAAVAAIAAKADVNFLNERYFIVITSFRKSFPFLSCRCVGRYICCKTSSSTRASSL